MRDEQRDCYTYTLKNSLNRVVFYVGKGTGDRLNDHVRDARRGVQSATCDMIRSLWISGSEVLAERECEHLTTVEALNREQYLQEYYGRENLTNTLERKNKRKPVRVSLWINGSLLIQMEECMRQEGIEYSHGDCQEYVRDICLKAISEYVAKLIPEPLTI